MWLPLALACARPVPQPGGDTAPPTTESGWQLGHIPPVDDTARGSSQDVCQFSPCESDPVGTWTFGVGCPGTGLEHRYIAGNCAEIDRNEWQQWTGSATFTAEGAADLTISQWDYWETYSVPVGCVTGTCADPWETTLGWTCTQQPDHSCLCTDHDVQTSDVTQHLEWWALGADIAIGRQDTTAGSSTLGTYQLCNDGAQLQLRENDFGYLINATTWGGSSRAGPPALPVNSSL